MTLPDYADLELNQKLYAEDKYKLLQEEINKLEERINELEATGKKSSTKTTRKTASKK